MKTWLLLLENDPHPGSWNMAVDDFLFQKAGREAPLTILRFYRWLRPTISLGCSQKIDEVIDVAACRQHQVDVVRRPTGGKVVLHHHEITYAVSSSDDKLFTGMLRESYRLISQALVRGLELMGLSASMAAFSPPAYQKGAMACFAFPARDEIEVKGKKIIGSAQKRSGRVFLQHGSIPLQNSAELLAKITASKGGIPSSASGMISVSEALGREVDFFWAVEHFVEGFRQFFGLSFKPLVFTPDQLLNIKAIENTKYGSSDWTCKGEVASR